MKSWIWHPTRFFNHAAFALTPLTPSLLLRLENAVRDESRGELDAALKRYRSVLDQDPDNPEALSLLGRLECRQGDYGAAVFHLQRAARVAPDRADVHLGLGYALAGVGEQRRAVRSFLDALEADSTYAPAFVSLGCVFAEHKQHDLAQRAFDFARESGSEYSEVHYQLGKYYAETNCTEPALAALLNAQRLGGRFDDIHLLLARLYSNQGSYTKTLQQLDKHFEKAPDDVQAHLIKSATLIELGQYDDALTSCQLVMQRESRNVDALMLLGRIHFLRDDFAGARRSYQAAIDMNPEAVAAHAGLSEVSAQEGEFNKALHHIRQAGDPQNYDLRTALLCAQLLQRRDQSDEAIKLLNHRLSHRLDHAAGRRQCHFMLGTLHESQRDFARAFKHYTQANELKRPVSDELPDDTQDLLSFFNRDHMARLRRGEAVAPQPVFIIGLPGYAVELVKKLLGSHPDVVMSDQRLSLSSLANGLSSTLATASSYPEALKQARAAELNGLADRFRYSNFAKRAHIAIDADSDNADYLGFASVLFPNLRVIRITQNNDDLALDIFTQENHLNGAGQLSTLPSIYARIRRLDEILEHWKALHEFPVLTLSFESLVARPGESIERLLGFMRIDSHPELYVHMRKPRPNGDLLSESRSRVNRSIPFKPFMRQQTDVCETQESASINPPA